MALKKKLWKQFKVNDYNFKNYVNTSRMVDLNKEEMINIVFTRLGPFLINENFQNLDYVVNCPYQDNYDNINKNELLGQGKIRKYRFNGLPTDYDIYVEMENEDVYHVKKRGIMMRVKVSEDQYRSIVKMLTNINIEKIGSGDGYGGRATHSHNVMIKKKTGFFSCFACFKAV